MGRASGSIGLFLCLSVCAVPGRIWAQIVTGEEPGGRLRFMVTSWTQDQEGEKTLRQTLIPFFGFLPLGQDTEARLYLARMANDLEQDGHSYDLQGMTDARLQVNRTFGGDRFLVSGGASLPTGKTGLDLEGDLLVMSFLARDFLIYPSRRLGEGLGLNGLLGGTAALGDTRLGGSVAYHYSGPYEAYAGQGDYKPGNFVNVFGGLQRTLGRFGLTGGVTFTSFGDDTLAERRIYNRGRQVEAQLGGVYATPSLRATAGGRYAWRGRNRIFDLSEALESQVQLYGDELALSGSCSFFFRDRRVEIGPLVDLRTIGGNEMGLGSARNVGVGAQVFVLVAARVKVGLSAQSFSGRADDRAIDLSGFQVASSVGGAF
jgi:hypothetical protein